MSNSKPDAAVGMDWTGLLTDPDLARNLGKLLQAYRDALNGRDTSFVLAPEGNFFRFFNGLPLSPGTPAPAVAPAAGTPGAARPP